MAQAAPQEDIKGETREAEDFNIFESIKQLPPLSKEALKELEPLSRFIDKCDEHDDYTGEYTDDMLMAICGYLVGKIGKSR